MATIEIISTVTILRSASCYLNILMVARIQ